MSDGLRFACSPKRWKKLVADVRKAIGLETMFRRSGITAIILETSAGNCRFDLDESGQEPGQASGVSRPIKAPAWKDVPVGRAIPKRSTHVKKPGSPA